MQGRGHVLVVEDDPIVRQFLELAIKETDCTITSVADGKRAMDAVTKEDFDLVFTDLKIPEFNGLQVLEYVKKIKPKTNVVVGTGYGSIENAVKAMQLGALNYLTKPYSMKDIKAAVANAFKDHRKNKTHNINPSEQFEIIGESQTIHEVKAMVAKVAPTKATVLIEGETGVGKEIVADAIHQNSGCPDGPYVKVNCAALPDTLAESELFGYEKGAFTGAHVRRKGRFEEADGGTILLDEIGELSLPLQAKLLRVLQHKCFERLGNSKSINVKTRVIATTNRDLWEEVKEGRFRKDLYFRLSVVKFKVSPLRSRLEDVPQLSLHLLSKICAEYGLERLLSEQAVDKLCSYHWPGNVRELENTLEKAAVIAEGVYIYPKDIDFMSEYNEDNESIFSDQTIQQVEKQLIMQTLKKFDNNKTKAADALGITTKTLRNKLNEYDNSQGEENS